MKKPEGNIRCVRRITFDDSASYVINAAVLYVDPISRLSTANTMSTILPARYVRPCSEPRIVTMNTTEMYTAIITIPHNLPNVVMVARLRFSNNSLRYSVMGRISTGIPSAT